MIDTLPKTATGDLAAQTRNMRAERRADAIAKYSQLLNRAANPLDGDTHQLDDVLQDASLGLTMEDFESDASAMKSISRLEAGLSAGNSAALESRKQQAEAVYDKAISALESAKHNYQMCVYDVEALNRDNAKLIEKIEAVKLANPRACGDFSGIAST